MEEAPNALVLAKLNELAGDNIITLADIPLEGEDEKQQQREPDVGAHVPPVNLQLGMMAEEEMILDEDPNVPELCDADDDDNVSESGDIEEDPEIAELDELLGAEPNDSEDAGERMQEESVLVRQSARTTAEVRRYDDSYEWNLLNLSVKTAIRDFGDVAVEADDRHWVRQLLEKPTKTSLLMKGSGCHI